MLALPPLSEPKEKLQYACHNKITANRFYSSGIHLIQIHCG